MDFLSIILLEMIQKFNGERSIFGGLHILNGKKSVQPIQDSHLFQVESFYGLVKSLTREMVEDSVQSLIKNKLVDHMGKGYYQITKLGKEIVIEECKERPIPQLSQYNYELREQFWQRLSLTVQTTTSLCANKAFVPVIKDKKAQQWVKMFLTAIGKSREHLSKQLYHEIKIILLESSDLEASTFVMRLTGSSRIGMTIEQIAQTVSEDPIYLHVLFQGVIQKMMVTIYSNQSSFPLLSRFITAQEQILTESAERTFELLKEGYSPKEISQVRKLKINTIEDHVVEIALNYKHFPIEPYVSKRVQQQILAVLDEVKTKKLREIKDSIDKDISYFSIRLTLSKRESTQ